MKNNISKILWGAFALLVIAGIVYTAVTVKREPSGPGVYDAFAQCLGEKGATFYGAYWCPHCTDQKKLFGNSAKKLPYIECALPGGNGQTPPCIEKGIESYPTWIFADGTRASRVFTLEELASTTSCALTMDAIAASTTAAL